MNIKLENKNILFIAPKFFGYENEIIKELSRRGAIVFFVQENIDFDSFRERLINQLPKHKQIEIRQRYFINKFKEVVPREISIDYVFGIRLDMLSDKALNYLRLTYPHAKFVCYFWDAAKTMRNPELVSGYFDRVLTFDRNDAENHNGWVFRPLFFVNAYEKCKTKPKPAVDILFVGSLLPKRAELYLWLNDFCNKNNFQLSTYFYCKTFVYWLNMVKQKVYKKIPKSIVHNQGLSQQNLIGLISDTKVIFDCNHPSQSGLTIRTIESLGAKKKLITTNTDIIKYDFYDPRNIFIFNTGKHQEMVDFLNDDSTYTISKDMYEYYSIRGWIDSIFEF